MLLVSYLKSVAVDVLLVSYLKSVVVDVTSELLFSHGKKSYTMFFYTVSFLVCSN